MKMIRNQGLYPTASQSVSFNFSGARASCGFPAAAIPLATAGGQGQWIPRKTPAYAEQLYWQVTAERQKTEFLENVIFAVLGASGLMGLAVSLL